MQTDTPNIPAASSETTPSGGTGKRPKTTEMIERFKRFYNLRFDTDMARKLELSDGSAIGNWRRRDSIDLLLIADYCPEINMDWLIWGRGTRTPPSSDGERIYPRDNIDYLQSIGIPREQIIMIVHEALESYLKETATKSESENQGEEQQSEEVGGEEAESQESEEENT